jgi:MFS family permease
MATRAASPPAIAALPWASFGPILAVHFLGTLGFSLVLPFLVFIVTDLGGAAWTYGLVGATYSACQLVGAPILGRWSDRAGRRPVLIASQVGTLLAWVLFLVALSVPLVGHAEFAGAILTVPLVLVFVARALDGATGGNVSVANAYVADITRDTPELRDIAFGRMGMAANLGFVLGPAAAGLLGGTQWGARLPIALAALAALATTIAIIALLKEPPGRCPEGPPDPGIVEAGLNQQAKPCHRAPPPKVSAAILRSRPVMSVLIATFILFLGFNFFYAAFPVHALAAYDWETGDLGTFFAVLAGVMIFAQGPTLGWVSARFPRTLVFAVGVGLLGASLVCFELATIVGGDVTVYLGVLCFAFGNGLAWPTFQARVAEVGQAAQGKVQGAVTSAGSAASIGGLVVGGLLYPAFGGKLFFVGAGLFVVVMLLTPLWFSTDADGDIPEAA